MLREKDGSVVRLKIQCFSIASFLSIHPDTCFKKKQRMLVTLRLLV